MTKAWGRNWTVIGSGSPKEKAHGVTHGPWLVLDRGNLVASVGDGCADRGTADLIAAAPEMARELLAREWSSSYEESVCPSCGAWEPYPTPRRPGAGHKDDCSWAVVLRKAGVIPPPCDHTYGTVPNAYKVPVCAECGEVT